MLTPGDSAPWFEARSSIHPKASFATRAGRYVVLCFLGSLGHAPSRRVLDDIERNQDRFDMRHACFCGVSINPDDERLGRARQQWPGVMFFWDFDTAISRLYGAIAPNSSKYLVHTLILDPSLRVRAVLPFDETGEAHVRQALQVLDQLPPIESLNAFAPALALPYVLEPDICTALIRLYEQQEAQEAGMLREVNGQTVRVHDHGYKQRTDCNITDPEMLSAIQTRLTRRVFPEILKGFQFAATHVERYIVACYDSQAGGHFGPHRDNTTRGSAHRKFAVTVNLNAEQYEGGDLRFPEYGLRTYRAPTGGAIIFSCSLLHEVTPVSHGKRYAFLPFLYDEASARIREAAQQFVAEELRG